MNAVENLQFALRGSETKKTRQQRFQDPDGDIFVGTLRPLIQIDPVDVVELCDAIPEEVFAADLELRNLRKGSAGTLRRPSLIFDDQGNATPVETLSDPLSLNRMPGGMVILRRGRQVHILAERAKYLLEAYKSQSQETTNAS